MTSPPKEKSALTREEEQLSTFMATVVGGVCVLLIERGESCRCTPSVQETERVGGWWAKGQQRRGEGCAGRVMKAEGVRERDRIWIQS